MTANVELRVKSRIKNAAADQEFAYSNPISFAVTPFKANPDDLFPSIALPRELWWY